MKILLLILKNLRRSPLRTMLTAIGTMVLVFVVTGLWSMLNLIDEATAEKNQNLKIIITEKWELPSRMPMAYVPTLLEGAAEKPDDARPLDWMTWTFYGGTLDPKNRTPDNTMFCFAMEPEKVMTMMDEIEDFTGAPRAEAQRLVDQMLEKPDRIVIGEDRLRQIGKQIGDRIKLTSINYRGIDLEFEIVGVFPPQAARYSKLALFNRAYFDRAMEQYPRTHQNQQHPQAARTINLVWLRVDNRRDFERIAEQISSSPAFTVPAVKCETAAAGVGNFLQSFRTLLDAMRFLLVPAILVTLSLVISNAISISVRERGKEFAVLKVLGYRPRHLLLLVLGEAVVVGGVSGLLSAGGAYLGVNHFLGGIKFPIAFFGVFLIPKAALGWGLSIGVGTAIVGSVLPAIAATRIKVAEVFAKVN